MDLQIGQQLRASARFGHEQGHDVLACLQQPGDVVSAPDGIDGLVESHCVFLHVDDDPVDRQSIVRIDRQAEPSLLVTPLDLELPPHATDGMVEVGGGDPVSGSGRNHGAGRMVDPAAENGLRHTGGLPMPVVEVDFEPPAGPPFDPFPASPKLVRSDVTDRLTRDESGLHRSQRWERHAFLQRGNGNDVRPALQLSRDVRHHRRTETAFRGPSDRPPVDVHFELIAADNFQPRMPRPFVQEELAPQVDLATLQVPGTQGRAVTADEIFPAGRRAEDSERQVS